MKSVFKLNTDENIRFDEKRNVWVFELLKNDYLDGIERWVEVGQFSSKGRAQSAIKQSR
jgi:hypothetical protein